MSAPDCPLCGVPMRECSRAWVAMNPGAYHFECRSPVCWCRGWANEDGSVTITRTVMETAREISARLPKKEAAPSACDAT